MAAGVAPTNLDRLRTFSLSGPMFDWRSGRELTCVLVTVCLLAGRAAADEPDFMTDFLKQEYSLAKPYRGETSRTGGLVRARLGLFKPR